MRHRFYQVTLTVAMVSICVVSVAKPDFTTHAAVGGLVANLMWIWER